MGFGEKDTAWPRKCYNGVKNWQLKWYEDRQIRVNPFKAYFITLAAFVDYEKATSEEPCLVNIGNMYFIQFNRARKFNHDTEEKVSPYRQKMLLIFRNYYSILSSHLPT